MDFSNTVLIMTSNLGSEALVQAQGGPAQAQAQAREAVMQVVKASFRPEFLNRLDEVVMFQPLSEVWLRS